MIKVYHNSWLIEFYQTIIHILANFVIIENNLFQPNNNEDKWWIVVLIINYCNKVVMELSSIGQYRNR